MIYAKSILFFLLFIFAVNPEKHAIRNEKTVKTQVVRCQHTGSAENKNGSAGIADPPDKQQNKKSAYKKLRNDTTYQLVTIYFGTHVVNPY